MANDATSAKHMIRPAERSFLLKFFIVQSLYMLLRIVFVCDNLKSEISENVLQAAAFIFWSGSKTGENAGVF